MTSAVPTPDGLGYLVLLGNGQVYPYGDAGSDGSPPASDFDGLDPATSIFTTSDGAGYWVSSALGAVYHLRGRAQRRRDDGHPPQRVDHRRHRVLILLPGSTPVSGSGVARTVRHASAQPVVPCACARMAGTSNRA